MDFRRYLDPFLCALCVLVLCIGLLLAGGAAAQTPSLPGQPQQGTPEKQAQPSQQELRDLLATLKDEEARNRLVARLEALVQANAELRAEEERKGEGLGSRVLGGLSHRLENVSRDLVAGARVAVDLPRLWQWAQAQFTDPGRRNLWLRTLWKGALVVVIGLLVAWMLRLLLGRMRAALGARSAASSLWVRVPVLLARTALDLVPVAAFVAAAYATMAALEPAPSVRAVTLLLVQAIAVAQLIMVAARLVFTPRTGGLRLLPLDDEDAHYLFIWVRRLTNVAVYGYFIAEAAMLTGLSEPGAAALLHLVGFFFLLMTIVFVMQNRQTVARWLRGSEEGSVPLRVLRQRFADVWHVLACIYLVAMFLVWVMAVEGGFRFILTATLLSLLIFAATRFAIIGLRRGVQRLFALRQEVQEQFPQLQARTNRYLPLLERAGILIIDVIAAFALLEAWGIDSFAWLATPVGHRLMSSALAIAGFVIGAIIIWEGASAAIERYLAQQNAGADRATTRARTLLPLFRTSLAILLVTVVALVTLSELGVNIAPLLAGAGVVGLAIGFGSQTLVKDVITGTFILMEDQIAVGDVVKVGTHSGLVESLTLRTIRMRGLDGNLHVVPFSEVTTVENMTKDYSRYIFNVGVAYREDTDQVVEVLCQIGEEMQNDEAYKDLILEPLEILGVDGFADSAVIIKARITTRPIQQWRVGREFNRRMKKKFDELGIEIPFPHRTLYFGENKAGGAPPAFVQLEDRQKRHGGEGARQPEPSASDPAPETEEKRQG